MSSSHLGRVKFYDLSKRCAFVEGFDSGKDAYLGDEGIVSPPLEPGDLIQFEVAPPRAGKSPRVLFIVRVQTSDLTALFARYSQMMDLSL